MKIVSVLLNTIDRYDMTVRCIGPALRIAGYPFELLWCDNGSEDKRVLDYMRSLNPVFTCLNDRNEGCAQMHNQMMLQARGDWFCLLDNDIEITRKDWLRDLVETYEAVPNSGMAGIHSDLLCPEQHAPVEVAGKVIHPALPPKEDAVFGTRLFGRTVVKKVGYFSEEYGPYGLVDNEYNTRVHHSGFVNYYIDGPSCLHIGMDVGENSAYRRMKDESMRHGSVVLAANMRRYFETGNFYIGPPALR